VNVHFALTVAVDHHGERLALELRGQIQNEQVVKWHMVAIATEHDHQVVSDGATVAISRVRSDAAHSRLPFLAQAHVQAEAVMSSTAKSAKVILLFLQVRHEVKAGVGIGDEQTALHVRRRRRVKLHVLFGVLGLLRGQLYFLRRALLWHAVFHRALVCIFR